MRRLEPTSEKVVAKIWEKLWGLHLLIIEMITKTNYSNVLQELSKCDLDSNGSTKNSTKCGARIITSDFGASIKEDFTDLISFLKTNSK